MAKQNYQIPATIPASIFRAYDIRGVVDDGLDANTAYAIGLAVGSEVLTQQLSAIYLGRDGRISSPPLAKALQQGLLDAGCDVIDAGMIPTPVLYHLTSTTAVTSGIMVTGSHNPKHYNGFKTVINGRALAEQTIQVIAQRIISQRLLQGSGKVQRTQHAIAAYIEDVLSKVQLSRPLKIAIDCGSGIAAAVAPSLFRQLGCDVIELCCDIDGNFPHHHPDPSQVTNLQLLIDTVKEQRADLGFAFDGDADRLGLVTHQGDIVWPDQILMLLAQAILRDHPGATVVYDVKCSRYLQTVIEQNGGKAIMAKTGHSLIKKRMHAESAQLAGEMSGHIFFEDRWYGFDDAMYAGARLLEWLASQTQQLQDLFMALPQSVATPEILLAVADEQKFQLMQSLVAQADFPGAKVISIDGLRVEYPDAWGLVRPSNTTPNLALRFEADTEAALMRIKQQFSQLLQRLLPDHEQLPLS